MAATQGKLLKGGERQTVIWSKLPMGSTEGLEGICQIVAILQYLDQRSADDYYPWFCRAILGKEVVDSGSGFAMTE